MTIFSSESAGLSKKAIRQAFYCLWHKLTFCCFLLHRLWARQPAICRTTHITLCQRRGCQWSYCNCYRTTRHQVSNVDLVIAEYVGRRRRRRDVEQKLTRGRRVVTTTILTTIRTTAATNAEAIWKEQKVCFEFILSWSLSSYQQQLTNLLCWFDFATEDPAVRGRLCEALEAILNRAQDPPKSKKVQHSNAKNAVLFEGINLIIHMDRWERWTGLEDSGWDC